RSRGQWNHGFRIRARAVPGGGRGAVRGAGRKAIQGLRRQGSRVPVRVAGLNRPSMSAPFDRRITPALAAEHLRGLVDAPRYAKGREARIVAASAPLRRSPEAFAPLETQALYGESVTVYDER